MLAHTNAGRPARQGRIAIELPLRYLTPPMNTHLAPLWLSDPAWQAMDATARGFHTQLLLLAARRRPAGTIPDDDKLMRRWLGIPQKTAKLNEAQASKAWTRAFSEQGMPGVAVEAIAQANETGDRPDAVDPDALTVWLWENRWKPMVLAGWERIDQAAIDLDPRMEKVAGGWFNATAFHLSREVPGEGLATAVPAAPARKSRKKVVVVAPWVEHLGIDGDAANEGLASLHVKINAWRDPAAVLSKWRADVDEAAKKTMWDIGVMCLVGQDASATEKSKARGVLGKYIKQYGEEAVGKAVSSLAMRSLPPADAVAFLQGVLRVADEGTPAQRAARQKRAGLCL